MIRLKLHSFRDPTFLGGSFARVAISSHESLYWARLHEVNHSFRCPIFLGGKLIDVAQTEWMVVSMR